MKRVLIILLSAVVCNISFAQSDSAHSFRIGRKKDTLKYFSVKLNYEKKSGIDKYEINGHIVDKDTWKGYEKQNNSIWECKPCFVKTYSEYDTLLWEGKQYIEWPIGLRITYYPDGKIKSKEHYKDIIIGENMDSTYFKGFRDNPNGGWQKDGDWIYYNEKGKVIKIEKYRNDTLVR